MYKYLFSVVLFLSFASFAFPQAHTSEEDLLPYGGLEYPGYLYADFGLSFGNTSGNVFVNKLVLEGKSSDYMLPDVDVEVGIVDRISLEFATGYRKIVSKASLTATQLNRTFKANKTSDGLNPIMLGANIGLLSEHKMRPGMYLRNQFYLPKTGYSNFQNEQLGYYTSLNMENNVSAKTYLDYSLGMGWDGNNPHPEYTFYITPNFILNDEVVAYFEIVGYYAKYDSPSNLIDIGTWITFTDTFSIEAYIGNELQTKSFAKSTFGAIRFTFDFHIFGEE